MPNYFVHPFPKTTSRNERGDRSWNGKPPLLTFRGSRLTDGIGRKLEDIRQDLALLGEQGKTKGFFNNVENADKLGGMIEDVRDAIIDYQVRIASKNSSLSCSGFLQTSLQQDIYNRSFLLIVRLILLSFPLSPGD